MLPVPFSHIANSHNNLRITVVTGLIQCYFIVFFSVNTILIMKQSDPNYKALWLHANRDGPP
jgi:hypothetical protein